VAITEKQRQQLFARAEEVFGSDAAATMMELIGAMAWDDLAKDADLRAARADIEGVRVDVGALQGDVSALKVDVSALKVDVSALKLDVSALKVDVSALKLDMADVKRELVELRIDLERQSTRMAKTFVGWMLASQTSLVGLVALIVSIGG
jgi:septal ring factor EnvC (AmiA/AmiB activator)